MTPSPSKAYALLKSLSISDEAIERVLLDNDPVELEMCKACLNKTDFSDGQTLLASKVNRDLKQFKSASQILKSALPYHAKHINVDYVPITASLIQDNFLRPISVKSPIRLMYASGASDYHVSKVMGLKRKRWMQRVSVTDSLKKERFAGKLFFMCKIAEPIIIRGAFKTGLSTARSIGFDKSWVVATSNSLRSDYGWENGIPAALFGEDIPSIHYTL